MSLHSTEITERDKGRDIEEKEIKRRKRLKEMFSEGEGKSWEMEGKRVDWLVNFMAYQSLCYFTSNTIVKL